MEYVFSYILLFLLFTSIRYLVFFRLNTITFSDDSNLICGGFENSSLRIWTLTPRKLRALKPAVELARIDKDAGTLTMELPLVDVNKGTSKTCSGGKAYIQNIVINPLVHIYEKMKITAKLYLIFRQYYSEIRCSVANKIAILRCNVAILMCKLLGPNCNCFDKLPVDRYYNFQCLLQNLR